MTHNKQISIKLLKHLQELHLTLEKYTAKGGTKSEFLILKTFLEPILQYNSNSLIDKICYRFRVEDIGVPQKTKDGYKVERVMYYDSDCEESLIPHTNIHGHLNDANEITLIPNGEYDDFKGKSSWKSKKIKEELISEGGGSKSFWVYWKDSSTKEKIKLNEPLSVDLKGCIFPDENSDYVDSKGNWSSKGKKQLIQIKDILNTAYKNNEFKSLNIEITYNCGDPRSLTGTECSQRAKNAINNTITRLLELGLKIPKKLFNSPIINAIQTTDDSIQKGIDIKITPKN